MLRSPCYPSLRAGLRTYRDDPTEAPPASHTRPLSQPRFYRSLMDSGSRSALHLSPRSSERCPQLRSPVNPQEARHIGLGLLLGASRLWVRVIAATSAAARTRHGRLAESLEPCPSRGHIQPCWRTTRRSPSTYQRGQASRRGQVQEPVRAAEVRKTERADIACQGPPRLVARPSSLRMRATVA